MAVINICKGICKIHPVYALCQGCYRSRLEIAQWHNATDKRKEEIIESCADKESIYGSLLGAI